MEFIERWNEMNLSNISRNCGPGRILLHLECLHAQIQLGLKIPVSSQVKSYASMIDTFKSCLAAHTNEETLRFNPVEDLIRALPRKPYCLLCGHYPTVSSRSQVGCPVCHYPLREEVEIEGFTACLVWTSIGRDLGIATMMTGDSSVTMHDLLRRMRFIRPYRSIPVCGADAFKLQCYFITHLIFVLSRWGAVKLEPRALFVEEYLFMLANMDVLVHWENPELVGEFVHSLYILGAPSTHPAMMKGHHYLLHYELKAAAWAKKKGSWSERGATFKTRYVDVIVVRRSSAGVRGFGADNVTHVVVTITSRIISSSGITPLIAASLDFARSSLTRLGKFVRHHALRYARTCRCCQRLYQ